ncbi:MAG: radical SAM protein [Thermoguttaceae bacterium]|nr:radical SAM protein [Thermoguttaceae bacterium]
MTTIRIARYSLHCSTLGPGVRGVVWVQGCSQRCPGCTSPEMRDYNGGIEMDVQELAEKFDASPELEGFTFSGGEPMDQAEALTALIEELRRRRGNNPSFMSYTGYIFEDLRKKLSFFQQKFVNIIDVLIDGPFMESQYANLLWRGSANQRVYFLTPRYKEWESRINEPGQGLEFEFDENGAVQWAGIPPLNFREDFRKLMEQHGVIID